MEQPDLCAVLNDRYPLHVDSLKLVRDSGSTAYMACAGGKPYFLRVTKPAFYDTVKPSLDIHVFLLRQGFSVPPIVFTKDLSPCVPIGGADGRRFGILYDYIEGDECDPETDAEDIGALLGRFHRAMKTYPHPLVKRDRHFYVGRYIDILRKKAYPKAEALAAYGEALWKRVEDLPRGYCHGDMYRGNLHKAADGRLYVLDFDTSCEGFPMYDPALICNMTDYFHFKKDGYFQSRKVLTRFLPSYLKYSDLTQKEIAAFPDLIALYHFALQATLLEMFGPDFVDEAFLDRQLDWLERWRRQCEAEESGICSF